MVSKLIVLALAGCVATSSLAAKKNAEPVAWLQEPTSFMGVNLSGDVVYDIPECPQLSPGKEPQTLCREKSYTANYYGISGLPKIGLDYFYTLSTKLLERKIQYLYLSGNTRDFDKVKALFITKYGKPTTSIVQPVKTKAGASFGNDVLTWTGQRVTISLSRYSDDINSFGAAISNNDVAAAAARKRESSVNSAASKL
ncbi:hypothetical protein NLO98_16895 [Pseudomonas syringae]|nr:hypothetical protein [Pseudomonas syringae]